MICFFPFIKALLHLGTCFFYFLHSFKFRENYPLLVPKAGILKLHRFFDLELLVFEPFLIDWKDYICRDYWSNKLV